ncbi:MAG: SagB/ThcOx family dehydrogenase [Polyangiaceae bacterium]|nr:SagB/ThcOx family dehydrogenase [Polyangiaceae bacterium]
MYGLARPVSFPALAVLAVLGCRPERVEPKPEPLVPSSPPAAPSSADRIALPAPVTSGTMSVEQALLTRRSQREFAPTPLPLGELGQLAWAAQGITEPANGLRTAPSAGALYPLELYFVVADGVLHYLPADHTLARNSQRDEREALSTAALLQTSIRDAPCSVVIVSVTERTREKYGDRAPLYVALEAGHVGQNLLLQATARGLAGVPIGAFDASAVSRLLGLAQGEEPLYIIALGYPPEAR